MNVSGCDYGAGNIEILFLDGPLAGESASVPGMAKEIITAVGRYSVYVIVEEGGLTRHVASLIADEVQI